MGDIHYIVDKLNAPPFQYNLSLLSFSEKTPRELQQLVSDVFSKISPKQKGIDVNEEAPEQTADRFIGFLKILKYKPNVDPVSFRQLLAAGDKDVIYPILKWVLPQPTVLEKRAFVGYYLSFPEMPDEFNFDPDIIELKEEIKQLQAQFVDVHKSSDGVKALAKDTADLKAKIKSLEEERERLTDKVARAKSQVDKVADKASYMDICAQLRKQQDDEVDLSTKIQAQKLALDKAEAAFHKASARLKDMQSSYQEGSAQKILDTLNEDVAGLRFQVNERYPKELEKRQKRLQALQEALSNGINTEMDLQRLQQQATGLHQAINEIQERKAALDKQRQGDKNFLQLRQAQQMAAMGVRKKEELQIKMDRLQEKKSAVTSQLDKVAGSDEDGVQRVSEEEWTRKYELLKSKLPEYKKMKGELGEIEAEVFVLAYTEETLQGTINSQTESMRKVEKQQGVAGFTEVATTLEQVSEAKSQIDEAKGMTLQEISRTVEEINTAINERKVKLAPQIKKLRTVRQQFAELEAEHNDKKSQYDSAVSMYEGRVSSLESEVSALKTEMMENESKFHLINCQLQMVDQNIKRVTSGPTAERLRDKFQQKINEADEMSRSLREKQNALKDLATTGLGQMDMMTDMLKLLQLKLEIQRRDMGIAAPGPNSMIANMNAASNAYGTSYDPATTNVMVL